MSWLSLPLPNPFKSQQQQEEQTEEEEEEEEDHQVSPSNGGGSVKEDLSELGKTISRQLWGVASFLAPPPTTSSSSPTTEPSDSSSKTFLGIRNDFAEISGSFKSSLSLISSQKISKLASNLLQLEEKQEEEDESSGEDFGGGGGIGVTEEVLEFVAEMSLRPECWTDFPLSLDDNDFDMSNAQKEHASTIERLAPSLAALRNRICPDHMNDKHFWMIYFILLHPRLNKHDSDLLSTAQIVEAREVLLHKVQKQPLQTSKNDHLSGNINTPEDKCIVQEKEVLAETINATNHEDEDVDQWLEEDVGTGTSGDGRNQLGKEQDVSFSDLEDDDNDTSSRQGGSSPVQSRQVSSPNGSSGWVQLNENSDTGGGKQKRVLPSSREKDSEGEESNEWLTVDEFD